MQSLCLDYVCKTTLCMLSRRLTHRIGLRDGTSGAVQVVVPAAPPAPVSVPVRKLLDTHTSTRKLTQVRNAAGANSQARSQHAARAKRPPALLREQ